MQFYPNATYVIPLTTIRRERRLPPDVTSEVLVKEGLNVEPGEVLIRGARASGYLLIDLLEGLGVRHAEAIDPLWIQVSQGELVQPNQLLAQRGSGRRAKRILSPADALVARIEPALIVLQTNPQPIELRSPTPGKVTAVHGSTAVQVELAGMLIQCAWGNGRNVYGVYRLEPEGGLETLADETLLTTFRGQILLTPQPLTAKSFDIAMQQEVSGIIAPSMSSELRTTALRLRIPVVLTEGFGAQQMSEIVYNLLRDNLGRQAAVDATEPTRWSSDRPEIIIPLPSNRGMPPPPERDQPLTVGATVRLTRAPLAGTSGRVRKVIESPRAVENGLRVVGAEVQLSNGRTVFAPIANIELLGRAPSSDT